MFASNVILSLFQYKRFLSNKTRETENVFIDNLHDKNIWRAEVIWIEKINLLKIEVVTMRWQDEVLVWHRCFYIGKRFSFCQQVSKQKLKIESNNKTDIRRFWIDDKEIKVRSISEINGNFFSLYFDLMNKSNVVRLCEWIKNCLTESTIIKWKSNEIENKNLSLSKRSTTPMSLNINFSIIHLISFESLSQ